ncbi:MAG TPA: hypothetical protein VGE68_07675 [Sphingomicrobium sp.]
MTYLGLIKHDDAPAFQPTTFEPARSDRPRSGANDDTKHGHCDAATRFAEICAAIGGTTMLHDLMPDVVTVSFGSRTKDIWSRLRKRGLDYVGRGEWRGEPVLGVSFSGDRRVRRKADELGDMLLDVIREIGIAETRVW